MNWINKCGVSICYQYLKSKNPHAKETLILIHGIGLDLHSWDDVIPYFQKNFHILRYDLRGHGESDAGIKQRNTEVLYHDLVFLIESLHISSYHIIAQGFGGMVGIYFASRYQGNLQSLILIGVPIYYPKKLANQVIQKRKEEVKGSPSMLKLGEQLIEKICYQLSDEKKHILLNSYNKVRPEVYFDLFNLDILNTTVADFQRINIPILMLSGSEDEIYPPEFNIAGLCFNQKARYLSIPDASFLIQMDEPKLTADWIKQFIEKSKSKNFSGHKDSYLEDLRTQLYTEIGGLLNRKKDGVSDVNELQVNMLDGFKVYINGKKLQDGWGRRKAKQILCYLVIHQSSTRDELCDVFWPDVHLEKARNRLRVSLHYLKSMLDRYSNSDCVPLLGTNREHVFLHGEVHSDIQSYLKMMKEAQSVESEERKYQYFTQIMMSETEKVLPGLYEECFLNLRTWLEKEWLNISLYLADKYEKQGNIENTIHYLEIALKYIINGREELNQRLIKMKKLRSKSSV
ncbi:alpha/beta hydrolase [Oceanobacillus halophilus]|uniref:alpha/beta hydrolase n=1 Tax=Oceanobacillus halophilus TaxID=930130 RepID=UPI001314D062|nr:alpha/beta hydrolase [Oceanobacillus halophilus]